MSREASGDTPELDRDEESADLDQDERQEVQSPRNARSWWRRRRVDPDDRDEILGKLFFEGERHKPYLHRFSLLQALSAVIAVLGVLSGSPAIVIGAMLLSPLMTPVLALAAGLTAPRREPAGRIGRRLRNPDRRPTTRAAAQRTRRRPLR